MICKGDSTTLSVQAVGVTVADYHWSTGIHSASIIATPTTTQTYSVTVTDIHGCTVSVQTIVSIDPIFVTLTATPHSLTLRGDTVQLASSSLFHTTHQWSGDSIFAYSTDSTLAYAAPAFTTIYCVTVSDTLHCTARGCDSVIVPLPDHIIEIPTAFTPNGDGINDRYRIATLRGISVTTLRIYNRWGQMVYVGDNTGWDGSYQGLAQPAGTYSCEVEYHITSDPERGYAAMSSLLLIR
jgi:gliding motility-associated-like protein